MSKKKLGLIRADTHGYYYGIMLDDCDPLLLQKHNHVCHHYASSIYRPEVITFPRVEGFEIVKVYDENSEKAKAFSETFLGKATVCETVEEMVDGIDAIFIADCNGGGGDHLEFARPFLEARIPTFVDKPFASTLADAEEIVRLASQNETPLFSASILTYVPAAAEFRNRFEEISKTYWPVPEKLAPLPIGLGVVKGVGGAFSQEAIVQTGGLEERMAYLVHGVALALHLFGRGVEWVETMGTLPLEYTHLHMKSGIEVMIFNTSTDIFPESCSFYASAYSRYGAVHSNPIGDPEFIGGAEIILRRFKAMLDNGTPPVEYRSLIEPIAILEAANIAQQKASRVFLNDVWENA